MSKVEIPIFRAGTYSQGTFDIRKVRKAVETTNRLIEAGTFRPPVKLGHNDEGDASGWLEKLREVGGVVFATIADISADLRDRIARKARRFVSAEIAHEFSPTGELGRSVGPVFTGLAVLGAERPQLKGLVDLSTITIPTDDPAFAEARRAGIVADGIRTTATAYFAELRPPGAANLPGPVASFAEIGLQRSDFDVLASDALASQRVSRAIRAVMTEDPSLSHSAAFNEAKRRMVPASEHETMTTAEFSEIYHNGEASQKVGRIMRRSGLSYAEVAAQVKKAGKVTG